MNLYSREDFLNEANFMYFRMFDKTNKIHFIISDETYKLSLLMAESESVPFTINLDGKKFVVDLHSIVDKFDIQYMDPISVQEFEKNPNINTVYAIEVNGRRRNRTLEYYIRELLDKGLLTKEEIVYVKELETADLNETAVSKSQQRLFGMAYAVKTGEIELESLPVSIRDKVKSIVKNMTKKQIDDYASTKLSGLPNKIERNVNESEINKENLSNLISNLISDYVELTEIQYTNDENGKFDMQVSSKSIELAANKIVEELITKGYIK